MKNIRLLTIVVATLSLVLLVLVVFNSATPANSQVNRNTDPFNVHKFGQNLDVDTAAAEDVWEVGGDCVWPTSATTTTIVSASTDDATGGTGARTVQVQGLDEDYKTLTVTASMSGTNVVTLDTDFIRVFRAFVVTAGSGETNAGNIQIKHGSTVLAQVTADTGQTLMACYTVPANYKQAMLCGLSVNVDRFSGASTGTAQLALLTRSFGGAWLTKETATAKSGIGAIKWDYSNIGCLKFDPKTDMRIRALSVSANDTGVIGTFDLVLVP